MRGLVDFMKTTIVGGFFVVLPVVLVVFLLGQAVAALVGLVAPLADELPVRELGGIGVATLLAILIVLALCFITGLLVRTRIGTLVRDWMESRLLNRLPGYTIIRNLTHRFSGVEGTEFAPPHFLTSTAPKHRLWPSSWKSTKTVVTPSLYPWHLHPQWARFMSCRPNGCVE